MWVFENLSSGRAEAGKGHQIPLNGVKQLGAILCVLRTEPVSSAREASVLSSPFYLFIYGVKKEFNFILLHVDNELLQHHLWKNFFSFELVLAPLLKVRQP